MRRRSIGFGFAAALLVASLLSASLLQVSHATAASGVGIPAPKLGVAASKSFGPVFLIVGENKSLFQLTSSTAPYIINTLKPESAWFTNYSDIVPGSLADYVALTSGQYAACQQQGPCGSFSVPSIFSQLGAGNWEDWNESMPSNCYPKDAGSYAAQNFYQVGHNPAIFYTGLPCSTYDIPAGTTGADDMSSFNDALAAGNVPEFNIISPNDCEDSHNDCTKGNIVTEYDNFLKKEIPLIEASPAFGSDGVIFSTYDEGYRKTADANTMMAVTGPQVQTGIYTGAYDHYSALATIEQGLGLPCLAGACTANVLPVFGNTQTAPTVAITQPADGSIVSGTVAVSGTAAAQGGASISQVQVSVDNGTPQTASGTTGWSASIDTTSMSNGEHTITATATDSNGLTGFATIGVTVDNATATSCPAIQPGNTEYSQNVSVESDQTGWTGNYNSSSVVTRVEPAGGSYDGLWALQVGIKSGSGQAGLGNSHPYWVTSTDQGTTYTGSVFVKASTAGEKVTMNIVEVTPSGTTVGSHSMSVTLADTGWHQVTDSYTAQEAGDVLHYTVRAGLSGTSQNFLADCLSLQAPSSGDED